MMSVIILGFLFLQNWLIWFIYKSKKLDRLTLICVSSALFVWYSIPGFLAAIYRQDTPFLAFYLLKTNSSHESWFSDFTLAYSMESSAVSLALLFIALERHSKKNKHKNSLQFSNHAGFLKSKISEKNKFRILVLAAIVIVYQVINFQGSYLDNNSAEAYGNSGLVEQIFSSFIQPISYSMTILIALKERNKKSVIISAFCLLTFTSILFASRGARVGILLPLIVYVFRSILHKNSSILNVLFVKHFPKIKASKSGHKPHKSWKEKRKLLITFFVAGCFLVFVFFPLSQSLSEARKADQINWPEVISKAFFKSEPEHANADGDVFKKIIVETIFGKLDSFTGGSLLVSESGYGQAGFTPYIGSMFLIFPRSIFPDRPIAGTSDGTIYTHPSRLVPRSVGFNSDSLNIPISPLHITFWHFGYIGLPMFVIALVFYFKLIDVFLSSSNFILNTLGLFSMSLPMFSTVIVSPDVVLKNSVVLLCFFLAYRLLKFLLPRKVVIHHSR
jgi:hypothetical protein